MKKIKNILLVIIPIIILVIGCLIFVQLQRAPKVYQLYVKLDSLMLLEFEVGKEPTVVSSRIIDETDYTSLKEFNFTDLELETAINKYLEIEKENDVVLTNVYIWTDWNNQDYFKDNNYKLNILQTDDLVNISDIIKPQLIYNKKYYKVGDEHNYNIVIKDDWTLEYHVDEHSKTYCDEFMPDECFEFIMNDEYYASIAQDHTYSLSENRIIIQPKPDKAYFGWVYAYDQCEIMYNALKCDYYNGYHTNEPTYQHTVYYELK